MRTYAELCNHPHRRQDSSFPDPDSLVMTLDECWESLNDFWLLYWYEGKILMLPGDAMWDPSSTSKKWLDEYERFIKAPETELKVKALWMLQSLGRGDELDRLERAKVLYETR